ncbi:WhiB family transcriptional regulator [Acidiferrimicrobium sp. IK]|uniref:WhiB family transcriptional regulator n=1 Tax=Acidiferrimicrobium sp. IK TaxID=2871700 RepID=UPI0029168BE9|nr:WhiB family transcriptional regulator [Acidiferrimicrobium sp. IK]
MSVQHVEDLWQAKASCRGPQAAVFFPPAHFERKDDREAREARAKSICAACPVRRPCLDYALRIREPHGIWGGLNETERRPMTGR